MPINYVVRKKKDQSGNEVKELYYVVRWLSGVVRVQTVLRLPRVNCCRAGPPLIVFH